MNELDPGRLREVLLNEFSEDELASLCQDIGLNYAKLPGMGVFGKTREIIASAQARHATQQLLARVQELRPAAFNQVEGIASAPPPPRQAPTTPTVHFEPLPARATQFVDQADARDASSRQYIWGYIIIFGIIVVLIAATLAATLMQPPTRPLSQVAATVAPTPTPHPATATIKLLQLAASATTEPATIQVATSAPQPTATATPVTAATFTPAPTATGTATSMPTATPTTSPTSTPEATEALSQTNPAVQAVMLANEQLIDFYSGKIGADALLSSWSSETSQLAISHAAKAMKKQLGIDLAPGVALQVTMKYLATPAITIQSDNQVRLNSREYWSYTHPALNRTACETIDYHYTLSGSGDHYQIVGFKGDMVDVTTDTGCSD